MHVTKAFLRWSLVFFLNYVNVCKSVCTFLLLLYMPIYWEVVVHMSQDKDQCSSTV